MKTKVVLMILALGFTGCSSLPSGGSKVVVDSSGSKPDWVSSLDTTFEKDGQVFVKSQITVRGDQRLAGCYDLSKLQVRQTLVSEISTEIKSKVHMTEQDLSENAEIYLGKTVLSDANGDVQGMRIRQNYFERYRIGDTERIDCYVLGAMSKGEYEKLRNKIVNKVVALDPKLKAALVEDQMNIIKRETAAKSEEKGQ